MNRRSFLLALPAVAIIPKIAGGEKLIENTDMVVDANWDGLVKVTGLPCPFGGDVPFNVLSHKLFNGASEASVYLDNIQESQFTIVGLNLKYSDGCVDLHATEIFVGCDGCKNAYCSLANALKPVRGQS